MSVGGGRGGGEEGMMGWWKEGEIKGKISGKGEGRRDYEKG